MGGESTTCSCQDDHGLFWSKMPRPCRVKKAVTIIMSAPTCSQGTLPATQGTFYDDVIEPPTDFADHGWGKLVPSSDAYPSLDLKGADLKCWISHARSPIPPRFLLLYLCSRDMNDDQALKCRLVANRRLPWSSANRPSHRNTVVSK